MWERSTISTPIGTKGSILWKSPCTTTFLVCPPITTEPWLPSRAEHLPLARRLAVGPRQRCYKDAMTIGGAIQISNCNVCPPDWSSRWASSTSRVGTGQMECASSARRADGVVSTPCNSFHLRGRIGVYVSLSLYFRPPWPAKAF
jgi:hypothetical protein